MLQQTQVKTVIPYWERWMTLFPEVTSLSAAPEERVLKAWEGLGYYSRARNLQRAATLVCEKHSGEFPTRFADVLALPGIGRYTAGAICSIAFGQPAPILDGNVARVLSRVFLIAGEIKAKETQARLWQLSERLVVQAHRQRRSGELNESLMELGALVCTPRTPLCAHCPISAHCAAFKRDRVADFPNTGQRPEARKRFFVAYVFSHGDDVLVRKRAAGQVNGGLWEFPNQEVRKEAKTRRIVVEDCQVKIQALTTIRHTITNNRIVLSVFRAELNGNAASVARRFQGEWRKLGNLEDLPFSSAHGKIRAVLQEGAH